MKKSYCITLLILSCFMHGFSFVGEVRALEEPTSTVDQNTSTKDEDVIKEIKNLISNLDHDDYQKRKSAQAALLKANEKSIPLLQKAAHQGSLELCSRIILIIEHHLHNKLESFNEPATLALESFLISDNRSLIYPSKQVWDRNSNIIENRAIQKVLSLGATVNNLTTFKALPLNNQSPSSSIQKIELLPKWKGGEKSLIYISRLRQLKNLYSIEGNGLNRKSFEILEAKCPDLIIQLRGKCLLGVMCKSVGDCIVDNVGKGTSADKAGVQTGDVIVKYFKTEITSFQELTDRIAKTVPGEKVMMTVVRNGAPLELEVTMQAWKSVDMNQNRRIPRGGLNPRFNPAIPQQRKKKNVFQFGRPQKGNDIAPRSKSLKESKGKESKGSK